MARPRRCPRPLPVRLAGALAALALMALSVQPAAAATVFTLDGVNPPLGMATDHVRGRYWVVDTSTGRLRLHAFGADGAPQGEMSSRDTVTNVQAVAFVSDEAWVGDVGGRRQEVSVYNVMAPWPGTEINHAVRYRFSYPDGAHGSNAIFVNADHRIHVVTTGDGAGIYQAPDNPPVNEPVALTRVADAPADVTDALALVDGRVALRTPTTLVVLDPSTWTPTGEAELPTDQRGQSLTQSLDQGEALLAAGLGAEVESVPLPGQPPPQPTATPTARTPAPQVPAAAPEDTRTFAQTGTSTALWGAVGVAAAAMLVVLIRR